MGHRGCQLLQNLDHFRCSRRMTGAVERELLSSALVLYELRVPGTFHGSTVVAYDIVTIVFHHATLKYFDCGSTFEDPDHRWIGYF